MAATRFFLGRLSQGQTLLVSYVTRGDAINDAPNCGTVHNGGGTTPERSCAQSTGRVDMPSLAGGAVGLSVTVRAP
ncbi:MAG: hypothetical protein FJW40_26465 [Acidobacteria bacterium]|nr:hypothetical protein [Acidobacteriota bacterium]